MNSIVAMSWENVLDILKKNLAKEEIFPKEIKSKKSVLLSYYEPVNINKADEIHILIEPREDKQTKIAVSIIRQEKQFLTLYSSSKKDRENGLLHMLLKWLNQ
ncbi:MAG: hypothetical protein JW774_05245 [Candidatus Aureabacteria bacterium]|nr:hypothetical protein [Candidatus Auribacterota bacterium]